MQALRICTKELVNHKVEEKANIEKSLDNFQKYWESLLQKIEKMTTKLKTLPDAKESFEKGLHQLSTLLIEFEQNKRQLNNNELSVADYKRIVDKLKVSLVCNTVCLQHIYSDYIRPPKVSLKDLEEKRDALTNLNSLYNYLASELVLSHSYQNDLLKTQEKFNNLTKNLKKVHDRISYLDICMSSSDSLDLITTDMRDITTNSTRKFLAEEEECSIETAIDEQNSLLTSLRQYEVEVNAIEERLHANMLVNGRLPSVVNEKLTNAQEMLRQSLTEGTDRMSSLAIIQATDEQKKSKLKTLYANIQQIEKTLRNDVDSNPDYNEPRSMQEERRSIINDVDNTEFMHALEICKNLVGYSRQLLVDLKNSLAAQDELERLKEAQVNLRR
jgi:hypothetical protein